MTHTHISLISDSSPSKACFRPLHQHRPTHSMVSRPPGLLFSLLVAQIVFTQEKKTKTKRIESLFKRTCLPRVIPISSSSSIGLTPFVLPILVSSRLVSPFCCVSPFDYLPYKQIAVFTSLFFSIETIPGNRYRSTQFPRSPTLFFFLSLL